MKTLFFTIILILFASLVIPTLQNAKAIPYMSPEDLYKQSDMVFYGQVISKQTGPGPDFFYYQVKVDTFFKNPQTSDSITVAGHKSSDTHMAYPQFEVGDKAIFYINNLEGINTISPFSTKAGEACNIHAFLGPAPIQGESIARNPGVPLALLDENGSMVGSSLTNHPVFLTYDIVNNYPFSKNFTLEAFVEDQNDTSITFYKKQVLELGACESTGDALKWSFVPTKSGTYSLNVNIDGQFRLGYGFQVTDAHSASNQNLQVVSSPLQQFKSGITANDIKCNQGLQLVIKAEDGSPACVKADTAIVLVNHRWATNVLQPNPMTGLNDDTGIATLKNQAYYFETVNYTDDAYKHPIQISFHDVIFTLFPSGFRGGLPAWGCGGSYYWADTKFSDGTSELLQIFVGDQQCFVPQPVTHFSNHTNPQAGLTFYDGRMKLLVSVNNPVSSSTNYTKESKVTGDVTYLSQTVDEWKSKTPEQLKPYYEKYKDAFYDELGSFLIKDEMKKELARQKIQNVYDDFKVFPGMSLDSLPPHISYDAVVNATDGNSYLLLGDVFANKIESSPKIIKLVFDKNALHSLNTGNGPSYPDPSTNAHVNNSTSQEKVQIAGTYIENSDIPWSSVGTGNYGVIQIGLYTSVYHMIPDAQKYYTARAMQLIPFYVPVKILPPPSTTK